MKLTGFLIIGNIKDVLNGFVLSLFKDLFWRGRRPAMIPGKFQGGS